MKLKKSFFYILLALFCLYLACLSTNYDWDLFARLIVGENFIESGILPYKDFLSYTPTHNWYDHEWGSGVVFYLFLKYFGAFGLILLQAGLIFMTTVFVTLTTQLEKRHYPVFLFFAVLFASLLNYLSPFLVRSHMFTFFFFSVFLYLLEKNRQYETKAIWIIPILTIIWNNLHGGVVSGLGIIFIYIVTAFIEREKIPTKLLCVLAVSTAALIINPYGIKYLSFLLSATTMERKYIVEWWSALHPIHIKHYLAPVLVILTMFVAEFKKKDITKILVSGVTVFLGLLHAKLLPLGLITVGAYCYNDIVKLINSVILRKAEKSSYIITIVFALMIPLFSPTYARADFSLFPLYEVEFLKVNNIRGNLVLPFGQGSYASYKLYPNNLIFMDGRYEEVYNNKEFLALRDFELAEKNWTDIINNYPTDILMPPKKSEIYTVLVKDKDWVKIFEGRECGIFVKKENAHQEYIMPEKSIEYYRKTMFKHEEWDKEGV